MSTTTPLLLLRLPLLVIKEVFKFGTTYELFALSILSKRAKTIVKVVSSSWKFNINFDLNRDHHFLRLDGCSFLGNCLYILSHSSDNSHHNHPIRGIEPNDIIDVFTDVHVSTYWDDKTFGMRWLSRHMLDTFRIDALKLNSYNDDKNSLIEMAIFLKTLRPIDVFDDVQESNHYTFEEMMSLMPTKDLSIQYPKMKYRGFISLFQNWMEGNAAETINFYGCPKQMSIRPLARLVEGRPEVIADQIRRSFAVVRNDGSNGSVNVYKDLNWIYFGTIRN